MKEKFLTDFLDGSSTLVTGPSGTGKSTLARGALEYFGSGIVVLAPGQDEKNSYITLFNKPEYEFVDFDDVEFQPSIGEWQATGHTDLIKWLMAKFKQLKADKAAGKELPKVLVCDTVTSVMRLAFNATLAKFKMQNPPPAISPDGASFYGYMRQQMEGSVRLMRAIRGLGLHWVCLAHPTEAEVKEVQKTDVDAGKSKVMPDIPGGYKNAFPASFDLVVNTNIGKRDNKGKTERFHYIQWGGDPKRVTKSRLGELGEFGNIALPKEAKLAWELVMERVKMAYDKTLAQSAN